MEKCLILLLTVAVLNTIWSELIFFFFLYSVASGNFKKNMHLPCDLFCKKSVILASSLKNIPSPHLLFENRFLVDLLFTEGMIDRRYILLLAATLYEKMHDFTIEFCS
jgi:hypothetical protein